MFDLYILLFCLGDVPCHIFITSIQTSPTYLKENAEPSDFLACDDKM